MLSSSYIVILNLTPNTISKIDFINFIDLKICAFFVLSSSEKGSKTPDLKLINQKISLKSFNIIFFKVSRSPFTITRFWVPNAKTLRVSIVRRLIDQTRWVWIVASRRRENTWHGRVVGGVAGAHATWIREIGQGRRLWQTRSLCKNIWHFFLLR